MVDDPYKPFNDAVKNIKPDPKQPEGPANPYAARDKDNVGYVMPAPQWGITGTSRQGPLGSMGYRGPESEKSPAKSDIELTRGDPAKDRWVHGKINDGSGYRFLAQLAPVSSPTGLDGGRIERLALRHENGYVSAFYDHSWQVKPERQQDQKAVEKIQNHLEGRDKEFQPIVPKDHNKDHGKDR